MEWSCNSCSVKNCNRDFLCKTCQCPRPTATRKIRPPAHVQRGKFMDKVVNDLVQKATKRKPASHSSKTRMKEAIRKKVAQRNVSISQRRRETLFEKQFKAKTDQITKLTQELESMRALVFQTSQSDYIQEQLDAIRNIGELMANPSTSFEETCDNDSNDEDYQPPERNGTSNTPGFKRENGHGTSKGRPGRPRKNASKEWFENACEHCDFTCKSFWTLCSHLATEHGVKKPFKCTQEGCDFAATTKYFLDKHSLNDHGRPLVNRSLEAAAGKTKTGLKRKLNDVGKKSKKASYRPTMIKDTVDNIERDVEMIESLLTDSEEEVGATDDNDKDIEWVPNGDEEVQVNKPKPARPEKECPHLDCTYKTSNSYHLKRHRRRQHGDKFERKKKEVKTPKEPKPKKPSAPRKKVRSKEKKYSCELCGAKAVSMWYINRHMRLHTGEKPFACEFPGCTYRSYRKFHITRHVINIHSTERPYKCELCDYTAKTKENLRTHNLSRHAPGHFELCEFCDFRAKLKEGLRSHVRKCHKFVCKQCSWEFPAELDLAKHTQLHREDGLHCEFESCLQVMKDVEEYKIHSFTIHGVQIQTRLARVRSRPAMSTCDICNYQFGNNPTLEAHKSYHTADGSILCQFCGLVCKGMEILKEHTVTIHGCVIDAKPKPQRTYRQKFTCSTCNYELPSRTALETHFQQHRLDGSVKCTKCPHISMKMSDLVQHYLIIHGERLDCSPNKKKKNSYSCDICKYNFPTASKLENHKNKHKEDGILCGLCKVTMPSMGEMKGHMMLMHGVEMDANEPEDSTPSSSSPNVCEICGYVFQDEDQLNLHRSCHMADGSICCTMCPYYSPNIDYLVMHMREIHHVELQRHKSHDALLKEKQLQINHSSKRELFKSPQLLQLQNSNAILHGSRADTLNSVAQSLTNEVESYIRPPACVFDTPLSIPNNNPISSFSSNVISGFSKSDFADFLQPSLPPQATISITNNVNKFVINNLHSSRQAMMVGGNRNKMDHNQRLVNYNLPVSGGAKSDPLSQAVSVSGLASSAPPPPVKQLVPKPAAQTDHTPKAKAHPGLFM